MFAISEKGYARGAVFEACVLTMYPDTKNPAIGFGQNDPNLKPGDTITLDEAVALYVKEGQRLAAFLTKLFAGCALQQQHVDALFLTTYNVGTGTISRNAALVGAVKAFAANPADKHLRDLAALEIIRTHPDDRPMPFNMARRCHEAILFVNGDYGDISKLMLWEAGKSPKHTPPDPPTLVPMPTFLKANRS